MPGCVGQKGSSSNVCTFRWKLAAACKWPCAFHSKFALGAKLQKKYGFCEHAGFSLLNSQLAGNLGRGGREEATLIAQCGEREILTISFGPNYTQLAILSVDKSGRLRLPAPAIKAVIRWPTHVQGPQFIYSLMVAGGRRARSSGAMQISCKPRAHKITVMPRADPSIMYFPSPL